MINTELLEKKDLREQLVGRVEILDKVGKLFLIPKMEVIETMEQHLKLLGYASRKVIRTLAACCILRC